MAMDEQEKRTYLAAKLIYSVGVHALRCSAIQPGISQRVIVRKGRLLVPLRRAKLTLTV